MRHAVLSRLPVIRFRFALWLPPRRGEEKPLQGTMAQRLTSAELPHRTASRQTQKDCAKQKFYAVFIFSVKSKGLQPPVGFRLQPIDALQLPVGFRLQPAGCMATAGWVSVATRGCMATAGCVSVTTDRCIATAGCVSVATHGCITTAGCVRLQLVDALQLWVGFDCNRWMLCNRGLCSAHSAKKRRDGQTIPSHFQPAFSRRRMRLCVRVRTP